MGPSVVIRLAGWSVGFLVGVCLAAAQPESRFPGVRPVLFGAVFLGAGWLGEFVASRRARRAFDLADWPRDRRHADGAIDTAPLKGVESIPNPLGPEFRRFVGARPMTGPLPSLKGPPDDDRHSPPLLGRVCWSGIGMISL